MTDKTTRMTAAEYLESIGQPPSSPAKSTKPNKYKAVRKDGYDSSRSLREAGSGGEMSKSESAISIAGPLTGSEAELVAESMELMMTEPVTIYIPSYDSKSICKTMAEMDDHASAQEICKRYHNADFGHGPFIAGKLRSMIKEGLVEADKSKPKRYWLTAAGSGMVDDE